MKIPIKHAIDSGAWFKGEAEAYSAPAHSFRFRVLSFGKINKDEIIDPDEDIKKRRSFDEGVYWLLKIEFVNLDKESLSTDYVNELIILIDQDDFIFDAVRIANDSQYYTSGLARFNINFPGLLPKIKVTGVLAFILPDEDGAEYYLSVPGGNIQEV